jgi:oxygen-independent coproporphyrinogen-3 oxidase
MLDPRESEDVLGLYVHFPWCVKKCPYCDFNSHPLKADTDQAAYLDALIEDWQKQHATLGSRRLLAVPSQQFTSVFFGGGTPSLFEPRHLTRLLAQIPHEGAEVTLEVNPGTAERHSFSEFRSAGINRLSLGAQSFADTQLQQLGRIHRSTETLHAFASAREAGFTNINVDLMWGLPGQTVEAALADLNQAIELQAEHISWYQLTIEAKTEFAKRPPILPKDKILQDIEEAGLERLSQAGYTRYEVSAFAKDPAYCRHNLTYWSFGDYLGIGAGAHGKVTLNGDILRTQRPSQPRLYQKDPEGTPSTTVAADQLVLEFMMNALRLTDGVPQSVFTQRTGIEWEQIQPKWRELVALGLGPRRSMCNHSLGLAVLGQRVGKIPRALNYSFQYSATQGVGRIKCRRCAYTDRCLWPLKVAFKCSAADNAGSPS